MEVVVGHILDQMVAFGRDQMVVDKENLDIHQAVLDLLFALNFLVKPKN